MNELILYNFASRQRPSKFFEAIRNITKMSDSENYVIVAKLDSDDPTLKEYLAGVDEYRNLIVRIGNSVSKIEAINRDIPVDSLEVPWDIMVTMSDDQRFIKKGFDEVIRQYCKHNTFVHFPDRYKKAACSVMSIMDRHYFHNTGKRVYHPDYYSLWSDVEATEVAKLLHRYIYVPVIIFEHNHYSTGRQKDELYVRNNTYKKDRNIYLTRRAHNFDLPFVPGPFLLIKYATRGRWRLFTEAIDNIYATIGTNQFKITVSADNDDVEMNNEEIREICKRYHNVELHYGDHKSKVEAINADFNPQTAWWWCVNMSDDMRFVKPYWDTLMLRQICEEWGGDSDFFAHFNDGYVGDRLPTMNICGRKYYDRDGYIYNSGYKAVSCDAENMFVAMMRGKYKYFDEVYFNHIHPANTKEPSDYIYRRNDQYGKADTEFYFERLRNKFGISNPVMIPEQMKPFL